MTGHDSSDSFLKTNLALYYTAEIKVQWVVTVIFAKQSGARI
jgi:hypothetical protein